METSEESIYKKIQDVFGELPANLNILEEQIDIDVQMEYFDFSKKIKTEIEPTTEITNKNDLFNSSIAVEDKKQLLVQLASVDDIDAYRTIERYLENPEPGLRNWAILALQESRMVLQSKLLDENQIFISTGLGGKGSKLRYFIVLMSSNESIFTDVQKKLIEDEFQFNLKKLNIEIEDISFFDRFCTITAIIPIDISLKDAFKDTIRECNQFGDFLNDNFIVTNVKRLSQAEIENFLDRHNLGDDPDEEDDYPGSRSILD